MNKTDEQKKQGMFALKHDRIYMMKIKNSKSKIMNHMAKGKITLNQCNNALTMYRDLCLEGKNITVDEVIRRVKNMAL